MEYSLDVPCVDKERPTGVLKIMFRFPSGALIFYLFHARNMLNIPSFLISSSSLTKLLSFFVYHPAQNLKELRHGQSILPKKLASFFQVCHSAIIHLNLPEL